LASGMRHGYVRIDLSKIPREVIELMRLLRRHGYEAYLVGGCVRDLLIGKTPHDYDIATNATPQEVMKLLEEHGYKVVPIGIEFGTVKVVLPSGVDVEVTTFRKELYPEYGRGGRRPVVQWARSLEEDVQRRDFTINALAVDVEGNVVDLVGGLEDLRRRIIRFVGNPEERILEDPLRMLRAVRFAATLGFELSPEAAEAIRRLAHHIRRVSWERIRDELLKTIEKRGLSRALELLAETSLLKEILPELEEARHVHHHGKSVFEHTVEVLRRLEELGVADPVLYLAALLHDVGKARTLHEHERESAAMAEEILRRLRMPNKVIHDVVLLVRNLKLPQQCLEAGLAPEKWLSRLLPRLEQRVDLLEKLLILAYADTGDRRYLEMLEKLKKLLTTPKPLVTGEMIMRLFPGVPPGKWIGELKEELYRLQLEIGARTPEEVLREAERRGILEKWRRRLGISDKVKI